MRDGEKRGVGWVEVFLLLFGEVVSVRFWVTALGLGSCAQTSHTPAPLQRGELRCCFLVGNERFEWRCFPS